MFIDSHAHIYSKEFESDREETLRRALDAGVETIIIPGTTAITSRMAVVLAEGHSSVYAAAGIHPHDALSATPETLAEIEQMSHHPRTVAIGEIGLDYHYDFAPRDVQQKVFRDQVEMAIRRDLPIIVHTRESIEDTMAIVKEAVTAHPEWRERFRNPHGRLAPPRGVFHCFSGTAEEAWTLIEMGFYVSFPGIVTFKNSPVIETVRRIGYDHLLIETDAPYMTPVPFRGKRNEPAHVVLIARKLAEIFGTDVDDIARATRFNTKRLFRIQPPEPTRLVYRLRNSLYINLTNRCNADCVFCDRKGDAVVKGYSLQLDREPSAAEIIEAIGDPAGYDEIVFCGYGEPTIRMPELLEVARWAKDRNSKVRLNTDGHGSIINKRNIVPELKGVVDAVSISLNSSDPDQYARLMLIPKEPFFTGMVEFAKQCVAEGMETTLTVVHLTEVEIERARVFVEREIGAGFRVRPYF